jgi:plastocyanin
VNVTVTGALPTTATVVAGAASNDFTPPFLVIARGGTVSWTFTGRNHNVTFAGTTGAPANIPTTSNSPTPVPRTFATAGTFDYNCTLHAGMTGTVVVP